MCFAIVVVLTYGEIVSEKAPLKQTHVVTQTSRSRRGVCNRHLRVDERATYRRHEILERCHTQHKLHVADIPF